MGNWDRAEQLPRGPGVNERLPRGAEWISEVNQVGTSRSDAEWDCLCPLFERSTSILSLQFRDGDGLYRLQISLGGVSMARCVRILGIRMKLGRLLSEESLDFEISTR